ncbi:MAG: Zn-ribbon domain-containing OB-fold protein [Candidatus Hermodarchaeota archaeon]
MTKDTKSTTIQCKKCGYLQHKSHLRCLKCKYNKFEIIYPSGKCKLLTFTILTATPAEFRKTPSYALGVVEYENGVKTLGQLTTLENLKTGMELKPIYSKICDNLDGKEIYDYVFSPN